MFRNPRTKTIAIAIGGLIALTLSASFADELIPQDSVVEAPTAPYVETVTPTLAPDESATVIAEVETVTVAELIGNSPISTPRPTARASAAMEEDELSESETPTVEILISPQPRITLRMPLSVGIDPRSRSYLMNSIEFWGTSTYLACFTGNGVAFDIGSYGALDDFEGENFIVTGDRSSNLKVSGTGASIKTLLRTPGGIRIFSSNGGLANRTFSLSLTALTSAAVDDAYCGASRAASTSVFSPLQIDLGIVKGGGKLK